MHVVKRMSLAVRNTLGDEGARDLEEWVEGRGNEWRDQVTQSVAERFDARLATVAAELRVDMVKMRSELRQEMANMAAQLRQEMQQGFMKLTQANGRSAGEPSQGVGRQPRRVDPLVVPLLDWSGRGDDRRVGLHAARRDALTVGVRPSH